jgi:CheY-like chemotaxis protein
VLNPLGFEIREASNGKDAIALWDSWEPHLIWMDMRMPVMDGYEAIMIAILRKFVVTIPL